MSERYFVEVAGETLSLQVERTGDGHYRAWNADGQEFVFQTLDQRGPLHTFLVGGQVVVAQSVDGDVRLGEQRYSLRVASERVVARPGSGPEKTARSKAVMAPMPGRISQVLCVTGAALAKGAPLVVIEAMKMQNELCTPADVVIRRVHVASGDTVDRGAVLVEFE